MRARTGTRGKLSRASYGPRARQGKLVEFCGSEFVALVPKRLTNSRARATRLVAALGLAHLFEPEARSRGIEYSKQREMIFFGGGWRQLYYRGRPIERLPTFVQHEVIVCRDEREDDCKRAR